MAERCMDIVGALLFVTRETSQSDSCEVVGSLSCFVTWLLSSRAWRCILHNAFEERDIVSERAGVSVTPFRVWCRGGCDIVVRWRDL